MPTTSEEERTATTRFLRGVASFMQEEGEDGSVIAMLADEIERGQHHLPDDVPVSLIDSNPPDADDSVRPTAWERILMAGLGA